MYRSGGFGRGYGGGFQGRGGSWQNENRGYSVKQETWDSQNYPGYANTNQQVQYGENSQNAANNISKKKSFGSPSLTTAEKQWHYIDIEQKIHGPFGSTLMRSWISKKYFPHDLKVRLYVPGTFLPTDPNEFKSIQMVETVDFVDKPTVKRTINVKVEKTTSNLAVEVQTMKPTPSTPVRGEVIRTLIDKPSNSSTMPTPPDRPPVHPSRSKIIKANQAKSIGGREQTSSALKPTLKPTPRPTLTRSQAQIVKSIKNRQRLIKELTPAVAKQTKKPSSKLRGFVAGEVMESAMVEKAKSDAMAAFESLLASSGGKLEDPEVLKAALAQSLNKFQSTLTSSPGKRVLGQGMQQYQASRKRAKPNERNYSSNKITEGKGFELLQKMGWDPDKGGGLGKDNQGKAEPIPIQYKRGKQGIRGSGRGVSRVVNATHRQMTQQQRMVRKTISKLGGTCVSYQISDTPPDLDKLSLDVVKMDGHPDEFRDMPENPNPEFWAALIFWRMRKLWRFSTMHDPKILNVNVNRVNLVKPRALYKSPGHAWKRIMRYLKFAVDLLQNSGMLCPGGGFTQGLSGPSITCCSHDLQHRMQRNAIQGHERSCRVNPRSASSNVVVTSASCLDLLARIQGAILLAQDAAMRVLEQLTEEEDQKLEEERLRAEEKEKREIEEKKRKEEEEEKKKNDETKPDSDSAEASKKDESNPGIEQLPPLEEDTDEETLDLLSMTDPADSFEGRKARWELLRALLFEVRKVTEQVNLDLHFATYAQRQLP